MRALATPALAAMTILSALSFAVPARTQETRRAAPADRAAIHACLKLAQTNAENDTPRHQSQPEKPGAQNRLAGAARTASRSAESCIGAIAIPCQDEPGGSSTAGMVQCLGREHAVWDEILNENYRAALRNAEPKIATALRGIQRAWLAFREQRCKLPLVENEGGTIIGPLMTGCYMEMTARQALWLDGR